MGTNEGKSPVLTREEISAAFAFQLRSNNFFCVTPLWPYIMKQSLLISQSDSLTSVDFGTIASDNS